MKRKKGRFSSVLLIIIFIAGLSLLLYPSVSNYVNSMHQTRAITSYTEQVAQISEEDYQAVVDAARQYNENILKRQNPYEISDTEYAVYRDLLNIAGNGVMGYLEIPSIEVSLPVYHGTSESVLQMAVGHVDWTSLPVGGESTHSVLSGHRGLPSAKLFTHLDELVTGDVFMFRYLDEVLTYEVDQILVVEPSDTAALQIERGQDYCTLVTCTPYGINTHRLLVRGHRIENAEESISISIPSEVVQIQPILIVAVVGVPVLIFMVILISIIVSLNNRRYKRDREREREEEQE